MAGVELSLVHDIRQRLRINHSEYDGEIIALIEAAQADLMLCGILAAKVGDPDDPLIKRCIENYVKAEFGLDNKAADNYRNAYESLKKHLMIAEDYTEAEA